VCGILSQVKTAVGEVDFIVLGMGINVNISYGQFPKEICNLATSLAIETGREISRQELIISLYENLAKWYKQLLKDGFGRIKEKMAEYIADDRPDGSGNVSGRSCERQDHRP